MRARDQKQPLPQPEALLWDARRRSWIMLVPARAFVEAQPEREPEAPRRRTIVTIPPSSLPDGPGVSWVVVAVMTSLLAIVCGLVAMMSP
jgi:hypothetical protein